MGEIVWKYAILGNYSTVRKSLKWTTEFTFHFMAVLNSFIFYNNAVGNGRFLPFKLNLIYKIFDQSSQPATFYQFPTFGQQFLQLIPQSEKKTRPLKRWAICTKNGKRRKSQYQCKNCLHN